MPDIFNGRLLHLINHKVAPAWTQEPDEAILTRWNPWWYDVEPLVQRVNVSPAAAGGFRATSRLAMQLQPGQGLQPTRLCCSPADEVFAGAALRANASTPLLGVCSPTSDPG